VKTQTLFVSVFALVLLQACNETTGPIANCNVPGLQRGVMFVTVLDSVSGKPVGNAVTATAIHGTYFDSETSVDLPASASNPIILSSRYAGKYDVYVSKADYQPWVAYNVVVKEDACGPLMTMVTAKLQSRIYSLDMEAP
jgi:hypothetical protein